MKKGWRHLGFLKSSFLFVPCAVALFCLPVSLFAAKTSTAPLDGDLDLARRLESAFVKVANQASESVVVISSTRKLDVRSDSPGDEDGDDRFKGHPFEFFFRQLPKGHPREVDNQGSGIILRKDGYILTNNHVIKDTDSIKVRLKDGTELGAEVIGVDDRTDIAIIKVNATDLPAARLGNSDSVKVGQWAIAIGAPYELDYSFTVGFVSAKGRNSIWGRGGSAYEDYIQTDASINPGNSGGPLCDIEGRVIGINTLIRGLNRGIGFAIPINLASEVADQLIEKGKMIRPWIGISIEALSDNKELAETLKDVKDGVVVRAIYPDTPAEASDLKPADVIVAVDGTPVKKPVELQRQVLRKQVGQQVTLDVIRDGKPISVALKTGEQPVSLLHASRRLPDKSKQPAPFGLTVQTLTKDIAEQMNLAKTTGVVVTEVAPDSPADKTGLEHGDIITEVDRTTVRTAEDFKKALSAADPARGALLYVNRSGASTFVVLKDSK